MVEGEYTAILQGLATIESWRPAESIEVKPPRSGGVAPCSDTTMRAQFSTWSNLVKAYILGSLSAAGPR